jgi:hypothetical protein
MLTGQVVMDIEGDEVNVGVGNVGEPTLVVVATGKLKGPNG